MRKLGQSKWHWQDKTGQDSQVINVLYFTYLRKNHQEIDLNKNLCGCCCPQLIDVYKVSN